MRKFLPLALCFGVLSVFPLSASVLLGDTVNLTYNYFGTLTDYGNQTVNAAYSGVVGLFNISVHDNQIVAQSTGCCSLTPGGFNGFVVTVLSQAPGNSIIGSVTVDPSTNMGGFSSSNVAFDATHVSVNWQGMNITTETQVVLNVQGNTPEPSTLLLGGLPAALLLIRAVRRNSRRLALH